MSKSTKAKKKEVELKRESAEAEKAVLELESARLQLAIQQLEYDSEHLQSSAVTGVFRFSSQVNDTTCAALAYRLRSFAARNPGAPITIVLSTGGGHVVPGFGLFDEIRSIADQGHHITTQVRGYAASMGAVLLQAGDTRLVGGESMVMIHEIASGSGGKLHEMENDVDTTKKLNTKAFEIMARRSGGKYTAAKLYAKVRTKDWWLDAETAVREGIADRIG